MWPVDRMPDGSSSRPLPAHIAAQLRSAGGAEDTGGQAWEGRNLGEGTSHTHLFPDDDGASAPAIASAVAASTASGHAERSVAEGTGRAPAGARSTDGSVAARAPGAAPV